MILPFNCNCLLIFIFVFVFTIDDDDDIISTDTTGDDADIVLIVTDVCENLCLLFLSCIITVTTDDKVPFIKCIAIVSSACIINDDVFNNALFIINPHLLSYVGEI